MNPWVTMIRRSWDVGCIDRDNPGAVGVFTAGREGADTLLGDVRVASSANHFLDGLLGEEHRKTGWMRAEAAGDPGPWRQQAVLGRSRWSPSCATMSWRTWPTRMRCW